MPRFAQTKSSYRGNMLSSTASLFHLLILYLSWQGVNAEPNSTTAGTTHISKQLIRDQTLTEEHVILKPQNVELSCNITQVPSTATKIIAFWRKDGKKINESQQVVHGENDLYILRKTFEIEALGNYSCVFSYLGKEDQFTFVFKVPEIENKEKRDKPTVSYVGDSVVLMCKMSHYTKAWEWYKINGTEKEFINDTADLSKYEINRKKANETKLTVKKLMEEDSGKYVCKALFEIGSSDSEVSLKVLSFSEPLKPFIAIAVEVVVLVTIILLYEKQSQSRKRDNAATENGPQSEQTGKLTQDESNGMDGVTTTRQRKVEN